MFNYKFLTNIKKNMQLFVIGLALVLLIIVAGIVQPSFFSANHLINIMYLNTMFGILAISQTIVILSGGIDMSVGAVYWITIMLGSQIMKGENLMQGILICLALGLVIGFINGFCIAKLKISFVVTTLAMMIILTGVLYVATGGGGGGKAAESLTEFSIYRIFRSGTKGGFNGIPVRTLIWVVLTVIMSFILNKTLPGWKIKSLGSNITATRFSGMSVERTQIMVYMLSGLFAVIAGLFYLGQARTPYPTFQGGVGVGSGITLQSIAAVVVGGTLFSGGKGGVGGTFLGVMLLSILYSLLGMVGLNENLQTILNGVIILIIVGAYSRSKIE